MNSPPSNTIPPHVLVALILLLILAVAPHVQHLSHWVVGFFFILSTLRLAAINRPKRLPQGVLLFLLTLGGIANVALNQATSLSKEIGIGLLVVVLGLKLMELHQKRDVYITVLIGFFVIITQFLYDQSMLLATGMILVTFGLITVLIEINYARPERHTYLSLRKTIIMLGQALPIMVVLFIMFPRFNPLWSLGLDSHIGITGFSDSISPGSVSHLSRSKAVAFRVDFSGPIPEPAKRYWRGLVLWHTDGYNWTTDKAVQEQPVTFYTKGKPVEYEVTMEPNQQQWLFSLDLPVDTPPDSRRLPDFQIQANKPITQRIRYKQRSYLEYSSNDISQTKRQKGLKLPSNITPRMHELVNRWQSTATSKMDIVKAALHHFNQEEFIYTLSPPPLGSNPADAFLFETRRGFCEHYATSFTLLMRLAGIPARVVAGYQGGEINPHGGYLIVRQSDAHAWTEVWLDNQGWVRIDPTAAVAPERVERPIDAEDWGEGAPVRFQVLDPGPIANLIKQFGFGLDLVNATWHRWVLGYTNQRQMQLLSMLGLDFLKGTNLGIAMIVMSGLVVIIITIGLLRTSQATTDPVLKSYQQFCRKLAKQKLAKRDNEGPRDYAHRIIRRRPDLQESVNRIIKLYIGLRYGPVGAEKSRKYLHGLVSRFSP